MNYWIFTASRKTKKQTGGKPYSSSFIFKRRMEDRFWGLSLETKDKRRKKNRSKIQAGDYVVFYTGSPDSAFVGTARIAKGIVQLTEAEREKLSRGDPIFNSTHGVFLEKVLELENPVKIEELLPQLSFIKNKAKYAGALRGGVISIPSEDYQRITQHSTASQEDLPPEAYSQAEAEDSFDPQNTENTRKHLEVTIATRRGQAAFRHRLLAAYERKCAVTGCDIEYALEAAHICPYINDERHKISNGLLLRADIHTLFDLHHISIDEEFRVIVSGNISNSEFGKSLSELKIKLPMSPLERPSMKALRIHRDEFFKKEAGRR